MKKFVSATLALTLCLSMVACSNKDDSKKDRHRDRDRDEETTVEDETKETSVETTETSETTETTEPEVTEVPEEPETSGLEFVSYSTFFDSQCIFAPEITNGYSASAIYYEHVLIDSENYPALKSAVDNDRNANYTEMLNSYYEIMNTFVDSGYDSSANDWIYNQNTVYRADSLIFSYCEESSNTSTDGFTRYTTRNYYSQTGETVPLRAVVDLDAFRPVLFAYMQESGDADSYYSNWRDIVNELINNGELAFTIAPDGIYVFFDENVLSEQGYWLKHTSFKIPYINNESAFVCSYFDSITDDYCIYADTNNELYYDIDNDGEIEYFSVQPVDMEYSEFEAFECTYNDTTVTFDAYGFSVHPSVIHVDGQNFLFVTCATDNDYYEYYVYLIGENDLTELNTLGGTYFRIVNPNEFEYSKRLHTLSTSEGFVRSSFNTDGTISNDGVYYLRTWFVHTSQVEIEGDIVDEDGIPTGESVLVPALSEYHSYRTDGETYVDFRIYNNETDNFDIVRFSVELSWENGQSIEGIDVDDAFTFTMYAG